MIMLAGRRRRIAGHRARCTAALFYAASRGNLEKMRALVEAGGDVNAAGQDGTILMRAVAAGHVPVAHFLIAKGADVGASDGLGYNALMKAAIRGHVECASLLVRAGADVNAKSNAPEGACACHAAARGLTALMCAAGEEKPEIVRFLVRAGADVNAVDGKGRSALQRAASTGCMQCVSQLLEAGADADTACAKGISASMCAAAEGHVGVLKLLIERGARVQSAKTSAGVRAIVFAQNQGQERCARLLSRAEAGGVGLVCSWCASASESCKTCSGCKVYFFCSKECQVASWKGGHVRQCSRKFTKAADSSLQTGHVGA